MEEVEIWKEIPGFNGIYKISNFGNVKSIHRKSLLRPSVNANGYLWFNLSAEKYNSTCVPLHRLLALTFMERVEGCNTVDHIDGNKLNNRLNNLQWLTHEQNISKGWEQNSKGRIGVNSPASKLNPVYVQDIRIMLIGRKYPIRFIAKVFGVTLGTVHAIRRGETWKHVA